MLTGRFKNASFGPPPNLHKCILLVEVYRFGQCLGKIVFSMSIFFSPACSRTLSEAAHSLLDVGIPNFAYLAL